MRRGDMEQLDVDAEASRVATALQFAKQIIAALCTGVAIGYMIWGAAW